MATYLPQVQDYIPQLEAFKPDYKFLSDVLQVRQDRYNTNFKQLNDLYGRVVYADLSREDNQAMRDQYANQLTEKLQQVSSLDLSLQENADAAQALFRPFYDDNRIVKDMVFTKKYQKEQELANFLKNSPDKTTRGDYWDIGVKDLNYQMQDFKAASEDQALGMANPEYVKSANLFDRSFEALKASGMSITQTTLEGDWIIKTTNGTALTRQQVGVDKTGKPIYVNPAVNYLKQSLLDDPIVQRAYYTKAKVNAREFGDQNEQQYGSKELAQQAWANQVISNSESRADKELKNAMRDVNDSRASVEAWEEYKKENKIVANTAEENAYLKELAKLELSEVTQNKVAERMKGLKEPVSDLKGLLNKAYGYQMSREIGNDLTSAAVAYSQVNAKQEFEANPFKVKEKEYQYNKNLKILEHGFNLERDALNNKAARELEVLKSDLEKEKNGGLGLADITVDKSKGGLLIDADADILALNSESLRGAVTNLDADKSNFVFSTVQSLPNGFKDIIGGDGTQMTYNVMQNGKAVKVTTDLQTAKQNLLKPENKAELERLTKVVQTKLTDVYVDKKSGALVYTQLPELNKNATLANNLISQYENINKKGTAIAGIATKQGQVYEQVFKNLVAGDEDTETKIKGGVPDPFKRNAKGQVVRMMSESEYKQAFVAAAKNKKINYDLGVFSWEVEKDHYYTAAKPGQVTRGGVWIEGKPASFNKAKAEEDAAAQYKNYKEGLNKNMASASVGDKQNPVFNTQAALSGQNPYMFGAGSTWTPTYTANYDHSAKNPIAVNQIKNLYSNLANIPQQEVLLHTGAPTSIFADAQSNSAAQAEKTRVLLDLMKGDLNSRFGKESDKSGAPNMQISYNETAFKNEAGDVYSSYKVQLSEDYAKKFKSSTEGMKLFSEDDSFSKDNTITVYVKQKDDQNAYSSRNQVMSNVEMGVQQSGKYEYINPGGGRSTIYKNQDGQYQQKITPYMFDGATGNIVPGSPEIRIIDPSSLDLQSETTQRYIENLNIKNSNAKKEWNSKR